MDWDILIRCFILSLPWTLLYHSVNGYFLAADAVTLLGKKFYPSIYLASFFSYMGKVVPNIVFMLVVFTIGSYLIYMKYDRLMSSKRKDKDKIIGISTLIFVGFIVFLRYLYNFTDNKILAYVFTYTGVDSLIVLPYQILAIIPSIFFGLENIFKQVATPLFYSIGMLAIPFLWALLMIFISNRRK